MFQPTRRIRDRVVLAPTSKNDPPKSLIGQLYYPCFIPCIERCSFVTTIRSFQTKSSLQPSLTHSHSFSLLAGRVTFYILILFITRTNLSLIFGLVLHTLTTNKQEQNPHILYYNKSDTMGANLSSTFVPDLSGVVISPEDRQADMFLGIFWAASLYACAMIFSTCALIDRWKGPYDRVRTTGGSVLGALLLSTAWPVVMAYLIFSPADVD